MARYVAPEARRDLKRPGYLHLDAFVRFPRVIVRARAEGPDLYGPFRSRRAAETALKTLHRLFPLRPCDFVFEPDPALELGLGCLYAQVRTCAAPCLVRVSEESYRSLALDAARFLGDPGLRPEDVAGLIPTWITRVEGSRGVVVVRAGEDIELYPVRHGGVLEESVLKTRESELEEAAGRLEFTPTDPLRDDAPWLLDWLHAPRRKGGYLLVGETDSSASLAERIRDVLGA